MEREGGAQPPPERVELRFGVGRKLALVTVEGCYGGTPGQQGVDLVHALLRLLSDDRGPLGQVPVYLHQSLLCAVHQLHRDEAALCPPALSRLVVTGRPHLPLFSLPRPFPQEGLVEAYNGVVQQEEEGGWGVLLEQEAGFVRALDELRLARDHAITALRKSHGEQMESICHLQDDSQVSAVVVKHIAEMDAAEAKWQRLLDELQSKQREQYEKNLRTWAVGSADVMQMDADTHVEEEEIQSNKKPHGKRRQLWSRRTGTDQTTPDTKQKDTGLPKSNDLAAHEQESKEVVSHTATPKPDLSKTFTVLLPMSGQQKASPKALHNIILSTAEVEHFCTPVPSSIVIPGAGGSQTPGVAPPARAITATRLYSDALHALVLLVDTSLSYSTRAGKKFLKSCRASVDFHFDDVDTQLQAIREETALSPLTPGDCYITRHSNLEHVHIVFHLVTPANPFTLFEEHMRDRMISGLEKIVRVARQHDVAHLTLPILPAYGAVALERSPAKFDSCKAFATHMLHRLRALLVETGDRKDAPLRTVQVLTGAALFRLYDNVIQHVFQL